MVDIGPGVQKQFPAPPLTPSEKKEKDSGATLFLFFFCVLPLTFMSLVWPPAPLLAGVAWIVMAAAVVS